MVFAASIIIASNAQAALLGISGILALPDITSDGTGTYSYTASTDLFTSLATPLSITFDGVTPINIIAPRSYAVSFYVDSSGNFTGGIPSADDLVITGKIDVNGDGVYEYSGTLLTGEVTNFGWRNQSPDDQFDFTFDATGGSLASFYNPAIGGGDYMSSENSNFNGDFTVDSSGIKTKHDTAPLVPEPGSMLLLGMGVLGMFGLRKKVKA
jgi:hypothetical protein